MIRRSIGPVVDVTAIRNRAERVVAAYEAYWDTLPPKRREWLRTMISGALVEQDAEAEGMPVSSVGPTPGRKS